MLRRPPFGSKVKSAHDMGREFAVLSKLAPAFDRAPRADRVRSDRRRARRAVLRDGAPARRDPAHATSPRASTPPRRRLCELLVDTLAELHAIDYRAAGLDDLGKPEGYVERQVRGWTERYQKAQTDDVPAMTDVGSVARRAQPADRAGAALIHNDFKYDNVVLDPEHLDAIVGVLDWEMATIGDPLMDLGTSLAYWIEATDPALFQTPLFGVTSRPGMWTRERVAHRYCERAGRNSDALVFYYVFGLFKTAVILQQIYYRYVQGLTKDPRFAAFGHVVKALADMAQAAIDRGRL